MVISSSQTKKSNSKKQTLITGSNIIVSLETSVKGGSISLFSVGKLIDFYIGDRSISGSKDLLPKISELLNKNKLAKSDVQMIGVSNGPGSFTGIRIGISTALALKNSLNINCYGINLLQAMAFNNSFNIEDTSKITAVLQGRNKICWLDQTVKKYFVGGKEILFEYINRKKQKKINIIADSEVYKTLCDKSKFRESAKINLVNTGENLSLIIGNAVLNKTLPLETPKPFYLNESDFVF